MIGYSYDNSGKYDVSFDHRTFHELPHDNKSSLKQARYYLISITIDRYSMIKVGILTYYISIIIELSYV